MDTMWGAAEPADLVQTWGTALAGFAADDIKSALEKCMSVYVDYPPTLPQFAGLCRDHARQRASRAVKLTVAPEKADPAVVAQVMAMVHSWVDKHRMSSPTLREPGQEG